MAVLQWSQKNRSRARVVTAFGVVSLVVSLAACEQSKEADKAKQAGAAPPPPAVVVAEVIQKTVPVYSEYVAQIEAKETVEIRARVQAYLAAQHFTEGTIVKKDQLLFTLDPREYEAKLLQAKAQLEGTQRETRQGRNRRAAPEASGCAAGRAPAGLRQRRRESGNRPRGSLGRQGRSRRGGTRLELLHDPLSDQRPDRQAAGVPGKSGRQGRGHAARHGVECRSHSRLGHHQRGGISQASEPEGRADGDGRAARVGSGRRQRLPAQGQDGHHRSGRRRQDRHSHRHRRVSEPECGAAPGAVRPRARGRRDCRERDPHTQAGGSGNPGDEDRAGGRCRQHGGAAHHQARRKRGAVA